MSTQVTRNIIKIANPPLDGNARTLLTADVAATGTSLTVLSKNGFTITERGGADYYVIIGNYGQERSEIKLVDANDTDNKILIVAALSGSHSASDPVTFIPYDKIRFYGMTSATGDKNLLATVSIACSEQSTDYVYTGTTYSYFCSAYYNTSDDVISPYSDIIQMTSYGRNSANRVIESALKKALTKLDESADSLLNTEVAISILNDGLDEIMARKRKWMFLHKIDSTTTDTVSGTNYIAVPSDLAILENLKVNNIKQTWVSHITFDNYLYNGVTPESGSSQIFTTKNNKYYLYPTPNGTYEVIYEYYSYPTEIDELSDTINTAFIPMLVFYCAAHFCYIRGNDKRGDKMYVFFNKLLEQQVEEFSGPDQLGNPEYVERTNINYMEE